jgi:hypothetical protein
MTAKNGAAMMEQPPSPSITPSPGFRRASFHVVSSRVESRRVASRRWLCFSAAAAYLESTDGDGRFSAIAAAPLAVIQRSALVFRDEGSPSCPACNIRRQLFAVTALAQPRHQNSCSTGGK